MPNHRVDVQALHAALLKARFQRSLHWYEVAEEIGVTPSLMTRLSGGFNISADALVSILVWLGLDKQIRPLIATSEKEVTDCSPDASIPTKSEQ